MSATGYLISVHCDGNDWDLLRSGDGTYAWCRAYMGDVTDHNRGLTLAELRQEMADMFPAEVKRQFLRYLDNEEAR